MDGFTLGGYALGILCNNWMPRHKLCCAPLAALGFRIVHLGSQMRRQTGHIDRLFDVPTADSSKHYILMLAYQAMNTYDNAKKQDIVVLSCAMCGHYGL